MEAGMYMSRYPNLDRHGGAYPPSRTTGMMGRSRGHTKHASLSYAPTYIGQENYRFPAQAPAPSFNGSHRYSTSTSGGHEAYPQAHYQSSAVPRIRVYLSSPSPAHTRRVSLPSYRGFDRPVRPFYDATNAPTFSGSRADSIFGSGNKLRKPRRPMF
ncbi:hypothetical protein EXIGLDRAFT_776257 [Exidia glandulosa HHB12029]|uniref:Uncharacterized protein n=1 Tax=Exidia glandulosa HHB12029 TaxID=1314781 RepID=A0A165DK43_EXIGL|nr:hypothetical protein EXIGLDRAFT_776257 [Exidia glandulosa HHB12029]